jgi:hypothetical protein
MGDKWLSRKIFQKISRGVAFFTFAGKGFESQWLCQNTPAPNQSGVTTFLKNPLVVALPYPQRFR